MRGFGKSLLFAKSLRLGGFILHLLDDDYEPLKVYFLEKEGA